METLTDLERDLGIAVTYTQVAAMPEINPERGPMPIYSGGKLLALLYLPDGSSRYASITEAAKALGISRQTLSLHRAQALRMARHLLTKGENGEREEL